MLHEEQCAMRKDLILIATNNHGTAEPIQDQLVACGYEVMPVRYDLGVFDLVARIQPALLVLCVPQPGADCLALCRQLRDRLELPVIGVISSAESSHRVAVLEAGADEVVAISAHPKELAWRVQTVLRRTLPAPVVSEAVDTQRGVLLRSDPHGYCVWLAEKCIALTPSECALLAFFLQNPDRTWTRKQLLEYVFGGVAAMSDRNIDEHIKNLRKKIEPDPHHPDLIRTVYRVGYTLVSYQKKESGGGPGTNGPHDGLLLPLLQGGAT
jgi:two-component system response regulator BaeR